MHNPNTHVELEILLNLDALIHVHYTTTYYVHLHVYYYNTPINTFIKEITAYVYTVHVRRQTNMEIVEYHLIK